MRAPRDFAPLTPSASSSIKATQQVPITLVLDNLHWADAPSLSLLEFLSQELLRSRLLIVGTYRDADASEDTVAKHARRSESRFRCSARSSGWTFADCHRRGRRALVRRRLSESAIKMIYQQTDGNPLFAIELIKVLIDESAEGRIAAMPARIPAGVRETIGRRLIRLSARCNELLCVAAVYGRQFTAREIAAAADEDVQEVLTGLEPAVQAGIVQSQRRGRRQLPVHPCIDPRDDLRGVARGLIACACMAAPVMHWSAFIQRSLNPHSPASHTITTKRRRSETPTRPWSYALRAADSAVRMYAYEDALLHYDRAIETLKSGGLMHDERLARAYILKGSALDPLGAGPAFHRRAARSRESDARIGQRRIAGRRSDVPCLCLHRMLRNSTSFRCSTARWRCCLKVDSVARAKALATLAFAQRTSADKSRIQVLVDEALAMASRSCDATARCACYQLTVMALRGNPESLHRRLLLGEEYIAVARSTASGDLLAEAYHWQALNYFESGQIEELETLLEQYDNLSTARFGLHQYRAGAHRCDLGAVARRMGGLGESDRGVAGNRHEDSPRRRGRCLWRADVRAEPRPGPLARAGAAD